jgi:chemotaxis protein CheC
MSAPFTLSPFAADELKELLNIGVSHASNTLSRLTQKRVTISVPSLDVKEVVPPTSFVRDPNEIIVAVLLKLSEGLDGFILLTFPTEAAVRLLHTLSGKTVGDLRALDAYDRSVFQEIGNVIVGGMLSEVAKLINQRILHSVPDVVVDMSGAMFNSIVAEMVGAHESFVSVDVAICVDANENAVLCEPDEESAGKMFLFVGPEAASRAIEETTTFDPVP